MKSSVSMQVLNQLEERASVAETRRKEEEVGATILEVSTKTTQFMFNKEGHV